MRYMILVVALSVLAPLSVLAQETPSALDTTRPPGLTALHISYASLQAFDVYTTVTAVNRGASEKNPMLGGIADKPVALAAMKAGTTALSIYIAEKLVKGRHKKAALVLMLASNAFMTGVAINNARNLR